MAVLAIWGTETATAWETASVAMQRLLVAAGPATREEADPQERQTKIAEHRPEAEQARLRRQSEQFPAPHDSELRVTVGHLASSVSATKSHFRGAFAEETLARLPGQSERWSGALSGR